MSRPKAVGIDLGTTFSVVAWVNDRGHTEIIRNAEGGILTPSIVLFEDTEVVVGKDARNALGVHPDRVAEFVKRDMGAPVYTRPPARSSIGLVWGTNGTGSTRSRT